MFGLLLQCGLSLLLTEIYMQDRKLAGLQSAVLTLLFLQSHSIISLWFLLLCYKYREYFVGLLKI